MFNINFKQPNKEANSKFPLWSKISFFALGIASTIWFLVRVIPKPARATYPCMRAAAPFMSSFVIYLLTLGSASMLLRKIPSAFKKAQMGLTAMFFIVALAIPGISMLAPKSVLVTEETPHEAANTPMGIAKGMNPGRVVWVYNPDATDKDVPNTFGKAYFMDKYTNQDEVDKMVKSAVTKLTNETTIKDSWNAIFKFHNKERGKGDVGYKAGEVIFIKINRTSTWGGNYSESDLSRKNNSNYAISETSPQVVTSVLRNLVNEMNVAQTDIYIGDPMKHLYKDDYDKWHAEFPNVHYLDISKSTLGREKVAKSTTAVIKYSDKGKVLREGDWNSALTGNPIYQDNLYSIFEKMEYMINIPTMKGHIHAGVTMFAKNHFGSQTREDAKHLHGGLVKMGNDPTRDQYGMYRVQVDLLSHELLGKKNLIYLMDALYSSEMEVNQPDKWQKAPWNGDWTSSVFISQDPVAIESVGFDFLYNEYDGTSGAEFNYPHYGAVDDYLHQAADKTNWPTGIVYDPEGDGTEIGSLGVHEHWNNATDMKYTRNMGTGNGIELVKVKLQAGGLSDKINTDNSSIPSNSVYSIYVDSTDNPWIGTDKGLATHNTNGWAVYTTENHLKNNKVNDIAYEKSTFGNEIWIATDGGLTVASFTPDGITSATTYTNETSKIVGKKVFTVTVDKNQNRWIGTDSAVNVFSGSTWASKKNAPDAMGENFDFSDYQISEIAEYQFGNNTIITTKGKGVARMSYNSVDGFTGASTYALPWSSIISDNITAAVVDGENQWYGSNVGACFHPSIQAKSDWVFYTAADNHLVDDNIKAIHMDKSKNVWIGTNKGVSIITTDGSVYKYTETEGLINNSVNVITSDTKGNVWLGTMGGAQWLNAIPGIKVSNNLIYNSSENKVRLYPNPASKFLNIEFTFKNAQTVTTSIFNLKGQLISTLITQKAARTKTATIDVSNKMKYPKGLYLMKVKGSDFEQVLKVNIQ